MRKSKTLAGYFKNALLMEKVEFIILLAALLAIQSIFISRLSTFFVLDDEFGYFSNAARFAGLDWSSATNHISYYSYGYSLILTPLFWIFKTSSSLYRAALVLNVLLIGGCYIMAKLVSKKIAPDVSGRLLNVICFVICLYPSYIVMSKIAHTETLQYFMFWLITYTVLSVAARPKVWKTAVLALLAIYMYTIHQRSVGICAAVGIVVLVMLFKRRIDWKQFLAFAVVGGAAFAFHLITKNALKSGERASGISNIGDYSEVLSGTRINYLLSGAGLRNLFKHAVGQLYYVGAASLIFALIGFIEIIIRNIDCIRLTSKKKGTDLLKEKTDNFIYIFLFVACVLTAAIGVYYFTFDSVGRLDTLIYGRYNEVVIGPAMLVGMLTVLKREKGMILKAGLTTALFAVTAMLAHRYITTTTDVNVFGATSTISLAYLPHGGMHWQVMKSALYAIAVFMVFAAATYKLSRFRYIIAAAVFAVGGLFVNTGIANAEFSVLGMSGADEKYADMVSAVKEDGEDWPIYYVTYGESGYDFVRNRPSAFVQLAMMDEPLICVHKDELKDHTENKYLFIYNELNEETLRLTSGYKLMMMGEELMLFKSGGTVDEDGFTMIGFSAASNGEKDEDGGITSLGEEEMFMFGPYVNISAGSYTIKATVECKSAKSRDKLGYIDVVSGNGKNIHGLFNIMAKDLEDGRIEVEIPITYWDAYRNLEVRAVATEGSIIRVSNVRLSLDTTDAEDLT